MLGMTKRADYALLALSYLTQMAETDPERLVNTKEIADQFEIPSEMLAKLLQILAKRGLIASLPGPTGGYRLARAAREISVADVISLVDGPLAMLHCSNGQGDTCRQYSRCTIRDPLSEIETRVLTLLTELSLEEICGGPRPARFEDFSRRHFAAGLTVD